MFHASPPCLVAWVFAAQEPDDVYTAIWVVGAFVAMVGVFLVYQKGQSGWTWREFGEGMVTLVWRWVPRIGSEGHYHPPSDDD